VLSTVAVEPATASSGFAELFTAFIVRVRQPAVLPLSTM
jgi:hypothetical protein